ncbi:MAG: hypothetical protein OWV35_09170 [Firmicutes bacterium]|nr:hypothetical protein [Bacillota bacterium]
MAKPLAAAGVVLRILFILALLYVAGQSLWSGRAVWHHTPGGEDGAC